MKQVLFSILLGFGHCFAQEIVWPKTPGPITAIIIRCDTENVPIYVDGNEVGLSPLSGPIQVSPGWHQVSYLPPLAKASDSSPSGMRLMRDIINLAKQDVLVEEGETVSVVLSYQSVEAEVQRYQQKLESGRWVGFAMMLITVILISWGAG